MSDIVIAIDGYSGTGKSSTAKAVARSLGYKYVDSGAMYRAATFFLMQKSIDIHDHEAVRVALDSLDISFHVDEKGNSNLILNGELLQHELRTRNINEKVSQVAAIPEVRKKLVSLQKSYGQLKGVVMDGRDIGTIVFPDAELKVFMSADVEVRAKRRQLEMLENGENVELSSIKQNLLERDLKDTTRKNSPLIKADDAEEIDTSNLSFQEQVDIIVNKALKLIGK
jgi:cytidylate kinase